MLMSPKRLAVLGAAPLLMLAAAACGSGAPVAAPTVPPTAGDVTGQPPGAIATTATTEVTGGQAAVAAGTYTAALPAADAAARKIALTLAPDGTATLATAFVGKGGAMTETGTWLQHEGMVNVALTHRDGTPTAARTEFVFDLKNGNLVSSDWDRTLYGETGLGTLLKQP